MSSNTDASSPPAPAPPLTDRSRLVSLARQLPVQGPSAPSPQHISAIVYSLAVFRQPSPQLLDRLAQAALPHLIHQGGRRPGMCVCLWRGPGTPVGGEEGGRCTCVCGGRGYQVCV